MSRNIYRVIIRHYFATVFDFCSHKRVRKPVLIGILDDHGVADGGGANMATWFSVSAL
jgi:hypothetical protein